MYYTYDDPRPEKAVIDDDRPIGEVLSEFMTRNRVTAYELAPRLEVTRATLGRWLSTGKVPQERMLRALLTLMDEKRA